MCGSWPRISSAYTSFALGKNYLSIRVSFCKCRQVSGSVSVWEGEGCSSFPWDTILVLIWQQQQNGSHLDRAPSIHQIDIGYGPDWIWRNILRCNFPAIVYTPNTTCWNWTLWNSHCCFWNMHSCAMAAWHAKTSTGVYFKCGKRIYSTSRFLQDLCIAHC